MPGGTGLRGGSVLYGLLPEPAALLTTFIAGASTFGMLWLGFQHYCNYCRHGGQPGARRRPSQLVQRNVSTADRTSEIVPVSGGSYFGSTTFSPNDAMTRGMIEVVLHNI